MENKYTLSGKKIDKLFTSVSNDVMDSRIALAKFLQDKLSPNHARQVDDELSKLMTKAAQNAIDLFKRKPM